VHFLTFKSSKFLLNKFYRTLSGFVAYVYNEQEEEQAAWMKYGGQEGYKSQYLYQNEKLICSTLVQEGSLHSPFFTKVPKLK